MTGSDRVWGLVLAGGESRRMGRDKALLRLDGATQLSRTVSLLERHVEKVFVSTRPEQSEDPERARYERIVDRYSGIGPVAGILSALERRPDVSWLVLACDLPNVDDATIDYLLRHRSHERPFTAYSSSFDGLPEPLCAIWRPESADIVRQFVAEGIVCPRKMLIRSDAALLRQPNPRALDNINTPADLARTGVQAS